MAMLWVVFNRDGCLYKELYINGWWQILLRVSLKIHSKILIITCRIGCENIFVACHFLLNKWFTGNWFSLVLNTSMSIGFLVWSFNGYIMPAIYNMNHLNRLGDAFLVGLCLGVVSMLAGLSAAILDHMADD